MVRSAADGGGSCQYGLPMSNRPSAVTADLSSSIVPATPLPIQVAPMQQTMLKVAGGGAVVAGVAVLDDHPIGYSELTGALAGRIGEGQATCR